ncbi:MAG: kelch repeat-containing protein, partial [bacterium]
DAAGYLNDTWEFDGVEWRELATTGTPPSPRGRHAMAYDAGRDVLVLFGGVDSSGVLDDTWELQGAVWTERTILDAPAPRQSHAMAYDPQRERVVLFGGFDGQANLQDTWTYNGSVWSQRSNTGPGALRGHAMTYDPGRGGVVVFGGTTLIVMSSSAAYVFDGVAWNSLLIDTQQGAPAARSEHAVVYDVARERLVLYGGRDFAYLADTWELPSAATSWTETTPPTKPPARAYAAMAYDSARGRTVLFGGAKDGNLLSHLEDTWEFDGVQWVQVQTDEAPSARMVHAMAYDKDRGVTVLFGGFKGLQLLTDTWEFDGKDWVETTPSVSPPGRAAGRMVYDSVWKRVVLFGGTTTNFFGDLSFNDTWEYDGTSWVEISPEESPPARAFHAMVYDSDRERTVVFSGSNMYASEITGTWEHDGSLWREVTPYVVPPFRGEAAMVYSKARRRTTLFGGLGNGILWDTWEYDGASWTQLYPPLSPAPRSGAAAAYDARRRTMVMFGGSSFQDETWEFSFKSALADEICGNGVDDDGDGLVDCDDPDCNEQPTCYPWEDCGNGLDDDGDGRVDCADPNCSGSTCATRLVCTGLGAAAVCGCAEGHWESDCTDGRDNDCDGLVDDDDPECTLCAEWEPIACGATADSSTLNGPAAIRSYACLEGWELIGPEAYYGFTAAQDGPVTVTVTGTGQGDPDLVVTGANGHDRCEPVHECLGSSSLDGLPETVTFDAVAGRTYFFIVDSFAAAPAEFTIDVQCD